MTLRSHWGVSFVLGLIVLNVAQPIGPRSAADSKQEVPSGFELISTAPFSTGGKAPTVLNAPTNVLYRTDDLGLPVVSEAGFVHLREEGQGFYYANILPSRRAHALKRGEFDTDNWGDVDAFRMLGRIVKRWLQRDGASARLGIEDISAELGGFLDYDGDGAADHRTHQLGSHVNILLPCICVPEVEVFFGRRDEDKFDAAGAQLLARLLFEEGAWSITTTSATRILDEPVPFPMTSELSSTTATGTRVYRVGGSHSLILMKSPRDHGNHFNARLTPGW